MGRFHGNQPERRPISVTLREVHIARKPNVALLDESCGCHGNMATQSCPSGIMKINLVPMNQDRTRSEGMNTNLGHLQFGSSDYSGSAPLNLSLK
jgi:hypothetical protein